MEPKYRTALKLTLTHLQKKKGHFLKNRELVLLINGQRHNEFLSHGVRVACLKKAKEKLTWEIEEVAEKFKNHPLGAYLWVYTPELLRPEEIMGVYRLYYILNIIEHLNENGEVSSLCLSTPVDKHIRRYLENLGINVSRNIGEVVKSGTINFFLNSKKLIRTGLFNFKCLLKKPNPSFNGVLIDVSPNIENHRYDNLQRLLECFPDYRYYSASQQFVKGTMDTESVVFKREMGLSEIISAALKTLRIWLFIFKNKQNMPSGIYHNLLNYCNALLYADLVVSEKCVSKYLEKNRIKKIIQVSTLTTPVHRLLMSAAKSRGTEFILVASRTFGPLELSDVLLNCDVRGYNGTALPDWFVFKDKYSLIKVVGKYPALQAKSLIGSRYVNTATKRANRSNDPGKPALLLLFNHREDLSLKLLEEFKKARLERLVDDIIYRCHHIHVFDPKFMRQNFPEKNVIDITGKDYSILENFRVVSVNGPTTAAMEVIQYGVVVLWLPYFWDESIIIDDVMRNVGTMCEGPAELSALAETFINDNKRFRNQQLKAENFRRTYFDTALSISDQLQKLVN